MKSEQTLQWVKAQVEMTRQYINAVPFRDDLERHLRSFIDVESYRWPAQGGDRFFYAQLEPSGLTTLYMQEGVSGTPRLLLDPREEYPDGSVTIGGFLFPSNDGRLLVYVLNNNQLWRQMHVLDVDEGKVYQDTFVGVTTSTSVAWNLEGDGFYYQRFDEPEPGTELTATPTNGRIMFHKLGTNQSEDIFIFQPSTGPSSLPGPIRLTEDGRYLIIPVSSGASTTGNSIVYIDVERARQPVELIPEDDDAHSFVGSDGQVFWFLTTKEAANGRVVAVNLNSPDPSAWRTTVPEDPDAPIGQATVAGEAFVLQHKVHAKPRLSTYSKDGTFTGFIDLPSITGYLSTLRGTRANSQLAFDFSNTAYPASIFVYDAGTREVVTMRTSDDVAWEPDQIAIDQVFVESADGTKVPMFLVYDKRTEFDGSNIGYVSAYGAFGWTMSTASSSLYVFLTQLGGVVAIPGARGGGEYGVEWHRAGSRAQKQRTFDDVIAGAEWLVENGYSTPGRLAVFGMSAGGAIPATLAVQRPDLFGLALPAWPLADMIRYPEFTGGSYWLSEYGTSADVGEFEALLAHSPYHNIVPDSCYPATLVLAGEEDQSTVPMHAYKYVAALQHAQSCDNPILLDVVWGGGHLANLSGWQTHFADYLAVMSTIWDLDFGGMF